MIINSPNVKSVQDCQRMFENLKFELEKQGSLDYGLWSFSGNPDTTNINVGNRVPNDYVIDAGNGGIIANDDYTFTLNANKLYELSAEMLPTFSSDNGVVSFRWYNEKTKEHFGSRSYQRPLPYTSRVSNASTTTAFIKTTEEQKISLIILSQTNLTGIYGYDGSYSYLKIKEVR